MTPRYSKLLAENQDNRLNLAKSLANTLYHLNSVQWVHKSLNPDNILLFGQAEAVFDWSSPYLVGFDVSRPVDANSDRLTPNLRWGNRVYIHPDRQREGQIPRFRIRYDIYSLGVVLLEIGKLICFKSDEYRQDKTWTDVPAHEVQKRLERMASELKRDMGKTYAEIVELCLRGNFLGSTVSEKHDDDDTELLEVFRIAVCENFDQINY